MPIQYPLPDLGQELGTSSNPAWTRSQAQPPTRESAVEQIRRPGANSTRYENGGGRMGARTLLALLAFETWGIRRLALASSVPCRRCCRGLGSRDNVHNGPSAREMGFAE